MFACMCEMCIQIRSCSETLKAKKSLSASASAPDPGHTFITKYHTGKSFRICLSNAGFVLCFLWAIYTYVSMSHTACAA